MKKELRVLMIEDTAPDVVLINHELRKAGLRFRSRRVESRESFLHELEHHTPDVILSDHGIPGFDGFAALAEARSRCPEVPFIFVTGAPGEPATEETLKSGADDYVLKKSLHLLGPAIERALRDADTRNHRRQLEAALLDAEEHLRMISAEFKEYAAFVLDPEGRVATWNPGAEQMLGYEPKEILGQDFKTFFRAEAIDHDWPVQMLENARRKGREEENGWRVRKGGEHFRVNHAVVSLPGDSSLSKRDRGYLSVLRDLTLREPDETHCEARDRAAQLEAANRELEEFTHTIALDLRLPLRHIESFSEILVKTAHDRLDPKSRSYLKTISDSAHQMSRLIDDLFTFSRISQTDMYRLHLSLGEIIKEVIHDLRPQFEGREIEWITGELPEVEGDPVMLWMVLTNLISNALKFTRNKEQARIEVGCTTAEQEFVVFVRDNGLGFDQHYAPKLFGLFRRLHGKEFEGTGVGLVNVRRIIERHGGRVWAEGVENEGATFYFSLPRTDQR
ncbi:MAG: response regulator [Akkermansiaceae bacterium]|nr:response regulator [Verrucomicrobiales bacterium]